MATFNDYIAELSSNTRKSILKIEFLRRDETVFKEIVSDLRLDGGLNINNKNGVRRSMSLNLDNTSSLYFPDLDTPIWIGKKLKLYLGLEINGEEYTFPSGVFVMDDPTVASDGTVSLNCVDKYALLDGSLGGVIDSIIIINAGTRIDVAVRSIMTLSQDPKTPIIDTAIAAQTLPYQIIHEEGSTLSELLEEIAFAYSCNVYYNEDGVLVFEKDILDSTKGSIWKFKSDQYEVNYIGGNSTYKFSDVQNDVLVIGDNINGAIARGRATNNDLLSPTSVPNIGFKRTKVVTDNIINTNALAIERAKYELKRDTQLLTETSLTSSPLYHLDVDRVVEVYDSRLNFNGKRSVINTISIPFNNSNMTINLVDSFEITL